MALNPIVLAVPFYFVGMGVEAAINRKLRAGLYSVDDTLNNLATGLFQQLLTVLAAGALMAPTTGSTSTRGSPTGSARTR